eukprot:848908-Ditylum_brightwellii.AAC.1
MPYSQTKTTVNTMLLEVLVDGFIGATNNLTASNLQHVLQAMLHVLHLVYPPLETTHHLGGDSCKEKKSKQGHGCWGYKKEILGWNFDGQIYMLQLPPAKCDKTVHLIKRVLKTKATP